MREFEFASFAEAIAFVDRLAEAAESENHHPDIDIRYRKVTVRWTTHSEGGITETRPRDGGAHGGACVRVARARRRYEVRAPMQTTKYLIVGAGMTGDMAAKGIREHDADGADRARRRRSAPAVQAAAAHEGAVAGRARGEALARARGRRRARHRPPHRLARPRRAHRDRRRRRGVRVGEAPPRDRRASRARFPAPTASSGSARSTTTAACARRRPTGARFVVIGGGFIGSEIAAALVGAGAHVTMVFPEPGIGFRLFPPGSRSSSSTTTARRASTCCTGETVTAASGTRVETRARSRARGGRRRRRARRRSRRPSSREAAGLEVDDGIVVDEYGRASGRDDVFAAGDVARFPVARARHDDARRARGSREHARQGRRREHGRRRRARTTTCRSSTPTSSTSATRPSGRSTRGSRPSRTGRSRTAKASSRTSRTAGRAACCSGTSGTRSTPRASCIRSGRGTSLRSSALCPLAEAAARLRAHVREACSGRSRIRSCSCSRGCACRRPLVVVAAGAAGLAAAVELGRGSLLAAALLVQLKTLLDNADGQLARLTGRTSAFGRYLDSEVDLVVNAALFAAIGWHDRTGRGCRLAGFVALTSVLSLNFNAARLVARRRRRSRSRGRGRRRRRSSRRALPRRLRAAGPARGVDRRAAAGSHDPAARVGAREPRHVDTARRARSVSSSRPPARLRLARGRRGLRHYARCSSRSARPSGRKSHEQHLRASRIPTSSAATGRPRTARGSSSTPPRSSPRSASTSTRPARATRRSGSSRRCTTRPPGYDGDPKLRTLFPSERPQDVEGAHAQIIEGPIGFHALCEHHALPFHGHAHVGYVAGDEILGISKLTRLVRLYARRFTVQERLAEEIAGGLRELDGRARRRGQARGGAPLHGDARRRGGRLGHRHDGLARPVRRGRVAPQRVPYADRVIEPFTVLAEDDDLPRWDVPAEIAALYGGGSASRTSASSRTSSSRSTASSRFPVSPARTRSSRDDSEADRFVLALLRACADAVVVGSGTLAASPKGTWRVDKAYPEAAEALAELRAPRVAGAAARRGRHVRRVARPVASGARGRRARAHDGRGRGSRTGWGPGAAEVVAVNDGEASTLRAPWRSCASAAARSSSRKPGRRSSASSSPRSSSTSSSSPSRRSSPAARSPRASTSSRASSFCRTLASPAVFARCERTARTSFCDTGFASRAC